MPLHELGDAVVQMYGRHVLYGQLYREHGTDGTGAARGGGAADGCGWLLGCLFLCLNCFADR